MSCILRCCMYWLTALDQPLDLCCGAWICPVCRSRSVHENWVQRLPELFSLFHFRCVLQNQILEGACPHYEIGNGACLLEPGFAPRISILRDIGVEKTNKKGKSTHLARQSGYLPRPGYVKHIYSYNAGKEINDRLMEQQLEEQGFYSYNYRQLISKASFFESHSLSGQPPECTGCCDWMSNDKQHTQKEKSEKGFFWSNSAPTPVNADIYAHSSRIPTEYAGTALSLLWQISRRSIPRDDLKKEKIKGTSLGLSRSASFPDPVCLAVFLFFSQAVGNRENPAVQRWMVKGCVAWATHIARSRTSVARATAR